MTTAETAHVAETATLTVDLLNSEDANVLARLLKQHIDDIVAAEPSKAADARRIHGKLGLRSTEPVADVTLIFGADGLAIKNEIDEDVDGTIIGPLKLQTETLAGIANPYTALLRRRLKLRIRLSRPLFTSTTYRFLKVPKSMLPAEA